MNDENLQTIGQVRQLLEGSEETKFKGITVKEMYDWIETVLARFRYKTLNKAEKGVIRSYIEKVSGYSRAQVARLIREYIQRGQLRKAQYKRHRFHKQKIERVKNLLKAFLSILNEAFMVAIARLSSCGR